MYATTRLKINERTCLTASFDPVTKSTYNLLHGITWYRCCVHSPLDQHTKSNYCTQASWIDMLLTRWIHIYLYISNWFRKRDKELEIDCHEIDWIHTHIHEESILNSMSHIHQFCRFNCILHNFVRLLLFVLPIELKRICFCKSCSLCGIASFIQTSS